MWHLWKFCCNVLQKDQLISQYTPHFTLLFHLLPHTSTYIFNSETIFVTQNSFSVLQLKEIPQLLQFQRCVHFLHWAIFSPLNPKIDLWISCMFWNKWKRKSVLIDFYISIVDLKSCNQTDTRLQTVKQTEDMVVLES